MKNQTTRVLSLKLRNNLPMINLKKNSKNRPQLSNRTIFILFDLIHIHIHIQRYNMKIRKRKNQLVKNNQPAKNNL